MAKGGNYEREFCRKLSLWWTGDADDAFWRTSNSGGRATVRGRKGQKTSGHYGDVGATDERGKPFLRFFSVELKRGYSSHSFADLIDKPKGAAATLYDKWFDQAERSRVESGAGSWLLVVRRDYREEMAFLPLEGFRKIFSKNLDDTIGYYVRLGPILGMRLAAFLTFIKPAAIMELET